MTAINSLAIFGGTFDPIHRGHIYLVRELLQSGRFEKVIVVPAGNPWQRPALATADDRLEMARLACDGLDVLVDDCEVRRNEPSYAIDTVTELGRKNPASSFTWVIGSDALAGLESWHRIRDLAESVEFLVIVRPGYHIADQQIPTYIHWSPLEIGALDISATEIRRALHEKRDVSSLLSEPVLNYIREKGLYGAA